MGWHFKKYGFPRVFLDRIEPIGGAQDALFRFFAFCRVFEGCPFFLRIPLVYSRALRDCSRLTLGSVSAGHARCYKTQREAVTVDWPRHMIDGRSLANGGIY